MDSKFRGLSFKEIGEAMRPENLRGEAFRLSREERDHIAGHALDSIHGLAEKLAQYTYSPGLAREEDKVAEASDAAHKIAALSNLLGDIGWEREAVQDPDESTKTATPWHLGELFSVAQLRLWLEEWQHQDDEGLRRLEELLPTRVGVEVPSCEELVASAQTKLGTGAILLARIEKWMTSHEN